MHSTANRKQSTIPSSLLCFPFITSAALPETSMKERQTFTELLLLDAQRTKIKSILLRHQSTAESLRADMHLSDFHKESVSLALLLSPSWALSAFCISVPVFAVCLSVHLECCLQCLPLRGGETNEVKAERGRHRQAEPYSKTMQSWCKHVSS